jgi:hypothetical protein
MVADAALRQLIAEQVKGCKSAKPTDGICSQNTSSFRKTGTVVKTGDPLPGRRYNMFFVSRLLHKKHLPLSMVIHCQV